MPSRIEVVCAPELSCVEWDRRFGARYRVAADGTHYALWLDLPGAPGADAAAWASAVDGVVRTHAATTEAYTVAEIDVGARPAPADSPYLYLVRMDVEPAAEEEFNRWYDEDHIALLSRVPGVYSARRFRAVGDAPRRYLALYHLRCPSVRQTAAWQRAAHTGWSLRIRRHHVGKLATMFTRPPSRHTEEVP